MRSTKGINVRLNLHDHAKHSIITRLLEITLPHFTSFSLTAITVLNLFDLDSVPLQEGLLKITLMKKFSFFKIIIRKLMSTVLTMLKELLIVANSRRTHRLKCTVLHVCVADHRERPVTHSYQHNSSYWLLVSKYKGQEY